MRSDQIMEPDTQLKLWVDGQSVHNGRRREDGECTPDFSCCEPELQWPTEKRREFFEADDAKRHQMMMGGLKGLLDRNEIRNIRVIG